MLGLGMSDTKITPKEFFKRHIKTYLIECSNGDLEKIRNFIVEELVLRSCKERYEIVKKRLVLE